MPQNPLMPQAQGTSVELVEGQLPGKQQTVMLKLKSKKLVGTRKTQNDCICYC